MDSYVRAVEKSRPGDWFTLWSMEALARQGVLLIRKRAAPVSEDELKRVEDWLNADRLREFQAVGCLQPGAPPEVRLGGGALSRVSGSPVGMGLRLTNIDESPVGQASTPAAGLFDRAVERLVGWGRVASEARRDRC
jgi:hypothetical protein